MKIFINYRQLDDSWPAEYIAEKLTEICGKESLFIDNRSTNIGDDIANKIELALKTVKILIVVIGKKWLHVQKNETK